MGGVILSKSLIQFSVDGWGCVLSLLFDLRPNYDGDNEDNGNLLQSVPYLDWLTQCSQSSAGHSQSMPLLETPGHSEESLAQSPLRSLLLSPRSWCTQGFLCALQESVSPILCKFCNQIPLASKVKFAGDSNRFAGSPGWEVCCGS